MEKNWNTTSSSIEWTNPANHPNISWSIEIRHMAFLYSKIRSPSIVPPICPCSWGGRRILKTFTEKIGRRNLFGPITIIPCFNISVKTNGVVPVTEVVCSYRKNVTKSVGKKSPLLTNMYFEAGKKAVVH